MKRNSKNTVINSDNRSSNIYPSISRIERVLGKDVSDEPITLEEMDRAIEFLNLDSSPGYCGLSARFWKQFWNKLRIPFFESLNESYMLIR